MSTHRGAVGQLSEHDGEIKESLYPLPSENYLLCTPRGPTTHNKAAGCACVHALLQSVTRQLKTFTF